MTHPDMQFHRFKAWAEDEGYDTAHTFNSDRNRWHFFNPMTADLWRAWQAATASGVATDQPAGWHVSFDGGLTWEYHADDPWGRLGERVAIVRPLIYGDGADWRTAGVAPAAPMQGLAAYLRAQASALERSYLSPKDAPHDNIDTLRQWALEVDSAAGVEGQSK